MPGATNNNGKQKKGLEEPMGRQTETQTFKETLHKDVKKATGTQRNETNKLQNEINRIQMPIGAWNNRQRRQATMKYNNMNIETKKVRKAKTNTEHIHQEQPQDTLNQKLT